jgi:hypothetical protein
MEKLDKELTEIKMTFSNGEEKIIKQGMVVEFEADKEDKNVVDTTFHMLNISGADLNLVVMSILELAAKLGIFDTNENEE